MPFYVSGLKYWQSSYADRLNRTLHVLVEYRCYVQERERLAVLGNGHSPTQPPANIEQESIIHECHQTGV